MFWATPFLVLATLLGVNYGSVLAYDPEYALDKTELSGEFSIRVLKPGIDGSRSVASGDRVKALLRTFSPSVPKNITGFAEQIFEAGKHPVVPLNNAIANMRLDEIRRVGIPFGDFDRLTNSTVGKMEMDLHSLQLKAVSEMLQLSGDDDADGQQLKTWKVLIYDDEARKLLSPILKGAHTGGGRRIPCQPY
ncbi:Sec1 family protein [Babesia ovata]|uniref:Sec1 family protein n=1 Tax=Babesia ovata TaxID=189622 RepID=A0A2H6KF22_9APIC|nr:Sec1 family protein [Babesia ovata]GBE61591.1 Sec1 family protein [Babesia ovata]